MARFDVYFDSEFSRKLERLSNFDYVANRMLNVAAPILIVELQSQIAKHRITSAMYGSVKPKIAKAKNGAWYVAARPVGKDKNGVHNMMKLMVLEFGKSNQPARPVLTTAVKNAESAVLRAMEKEYERIISE